MPDHQTPLIATIAAGFVLAFLLGMLAHRLRIQPIVGYLLAGVAIGPHTPGFVADQKLALELAEVGVILLMFGVGLHFSLRDLLSVSRIALPGAVGQIAAATLMGAGLALLLGWELPAAVVFGLALSVASTVVLVRALQERRLLETARGRIAVGWLVVEDLAMILALVLLPALAAASAAGALTTADAAVAVGVKILKVGAFIAMMLLLGRRVIPWVLHHAAWTGSRELFRLAVYAIAIGVAFAAAKLFDASFALGAFFAGMVLGESTLSQRATEEALPLRDAFAVLFFVAVGMLFDPAVLLDRPLAVLAVVLIILFGKSAVAYGICRAFGHERATALTVSVSLAQIGEFSFILVGLGVALGMLPEEGRDLVLAGAILSIMLNPLLFHLVEGRRPAAWAGPAPVTPPAPAGHAVIVGFGQVGAVLVAGLIARGRKPVVIEDRPEAAAAARTAGAEVVEGNAADPAILALARLGEARQLFVTIGDAFEAGQVVQQARTARPDLPIIVLAETEDCRSHLSALGASVIIQPGREVARRMLEQV
ncbi:MAG: cation:proton antiporter [Rhodovarius sp.]|nr:cation:proton antiporter [Rhodovarius sp.]